MIGYRHSDPRYPFLWEDNAQPAARWHGDGQGPVHYLADTPTGGPVTFAPPCEKARTGGWLPMPSSL